MKRLTQALITVFLPNGQMSTAWLSSAALSLLIEEVMVGAHHLEDEIPTPAEALTVLHDGLAADT